MLRHHGDVPNRGGERTSPRGAAESASYVLSGPLRWIERDGSRAALLVAEANAPGRRLIGQTLTLDLETTAIRTADRNGDGRRSATDLLPGEHVTVKARLPVGIVAPTIVAPGRLIADGP
jgi:hypothetical protein